eukprot:365099-Chlamydomonas_euryale.AAC.9
MRPARTAQHAPRRWRLSAAAPSERRRCPQAVRLRAEATTQRPRQPGLEAVLPGCSAGAHARPIGAAWSSHSRPGGCAGRGIVAFVWAAGHAACCRASASAGGAGGRPLMGVAGCGCSTAVGALLPPPPRPSEVAVAVAVAVSSAGLTAPVWTSATAGCAAPACRPVSDRPAASDGWPVTWSLEAAAFPAVSSVAPLRPLSTPCVGDSDATPSPGCPCAPRVSDGREPTATAAAARSASACCCSAFARARRASAALPPPLRLSFGTGLLTPAPGRPPGPALPPRGPTAAAERPETWAAPLLTLAEALAPPSESPAGDGCGAHAAGTQAPPPSEPTPCTAAVLPGPSTPP